VVVDSGVVPTPFHRTGAGQLQTRRVLRLPSRTPRPPADRSHRCLRCSCAATSCPACCPSPESSHGQRIPRRFAEDCPARPVPRRRIACATLTSGHHTTAAFGVSASCVDLVVRVLDRVPAFPQQAGPRSRVEVEDVRQPGDEHRIVLRRRCADSPAPRVRRGTAPSAGSRRPYVPVGRRPVRLTGGDQTRRRPAGRSRRKATRRASSDLVHMRSRTSAWIS